MASEETLPKNPLARKLSGLEKSWTSTSFREKESMVVWFCETFQKTKSKNHKLLLLKFLSGGLSVSLRLPLSYAAISALVKFAIENSGEVNPEPELKTCFDKLLSSAAVKNYLKQNEKMCANLFANIVINLSVNNSTDRSILHSLVSLYQSLSSNEKAVQSFLKKDINCLSSLLDESSEVGKSAKQELTQLLKGMLFGKQHVLKLTSLVHSCFDKTEAKSPRHSALFKALVNCCQSDLPVESKAGLFRLVVGAAVTCDQVEDLVLLRFIILISYLLGVDPKIGGMELIIDADHVRSLLGVTPYYSPSNAVIWNAVLEVLGRRALNLGVELPKVTGLQWFRACATSILSEDDFNAVHIDTLTALILLDSATLEPSLSKIFTKIFKSEGFSTAEDYQKAYENFLTTSMKIFSRLQRISKLILKLLPAIAVVSDDVPPQKLLPEPFLDTLSTTSTVLPSAHCLSLIQILLDQLESCVAGFQSDSLNATVLQCVASLLCTVISGCRLLCYSLPRAVIQAFIVHVDRLRDLLNRFGTLILMRAHDRGIMQPFLRLCHLWGETSTLASLYATDDGPPSLPLDSAPSDLSPTLPFLTGDQWSVFTERIANFGDQQCNQLLMKLLVQKLRVAHLSEEKSLVNTEATSRYMMLKSNVQGAGILSVMNCEELCITVNKLPGDRARALVDCLFSELVNCDQETVHRWLQDPILLESRQFVEAMFDIIISDLVQAADEKDVRLPLKELYKSLRNVSSSCLSLVQNDSNLPSLINAAFTVESSDSAGAVCWKREKVGKVALVNMPFGHIASLGESGLIAVTAVMVSLELTDTLLPVFERLLSLSKNVDDCFDMGLCIQWLVKHIPERNIRAPIVELLVVKSAASKSGLKQFKGLVKALKRGNSLTPMARLSTQIQLHNSIRKCWRQRTDPEAANLNDVIAKQRRRLNKGLQEALSEATSDLSSSPDAWVLLDAYSIELMRLDREGKVGGIVALNFNSYLRKALKGVKLKDETANQSSLNFLTTVLKCAKSLRTATGNEMFVFNIWRQLKGGDYPELWQHICTAASEKEFSSIMRDLLAIIEAGLRPPDEEIVSWESNLVPPDSLRPLFIKLAENTTTGEWSNHYIEVWKLFLQKSTGMKQQCCYDTIRRLISYTQNILPRKGESFPESLLSWLRFLLFIATHPSIPIRPELEDYLLDVVLAAPEDGVQFADHFGVRVEILSALVSTQKVPTLRKVPLILQTFQKLLRWLLRESDTSRNLSAEDVPSRALAAFHLEKWIGLFVRRKEEFRVIPLFITELIHSLASITIYPSVKIHLNNSVFSLLAVSDENTVKFLLRSLPPGCQQVFSNLHSEFQRFHRYKGKI